MSETIASLRQKIDSASDLQSVVRTMKALAAANIGQYESAVGALADYHRTVESGLHVCLKNRAPAADMPPSAIRAAAGAIDAVLFGSDQGLVGPFNDVVADAAIAALAALPGTPRVWAVGERVHARLTDAGLTPTGLFAVPGSVRGIVPLVAEILLRTEAQRDRDEGAQLHLFYNRPGAGSNYAPVSQRLLPLDETWRHDLARLVWPTVALPEVVGGQAATLRALIREFVFISLFRACAESLASENASRLAAMQRADKNIDDMLDSAQRAFNRLRQSRIDEELFDVVSGYEATVAPDRPSGVARRNRN